MVKETDLAKELEWIPLTKWQDRFQYPTYGCMRNICARRRENGAEAFLSIINGRFYINVKKFFHWMENQKEKRK
jgi:hypothetical protein